MELGQQIKQARENKNLSQEELAAQLGVSRQAVSKWENNSAIPQGINREMLSQILGIEISVTDDALPKKQSKILWLGWVLAAVLLCASVVMGLLLISGQRQTGVVDAQRQGAQEDFSETPEIKSIQFYDKNQNVVSDVALWYNVAEIDSILIQWERGTPDSIQVFYTPSGTETYEQTQLLMTKSISDGDGVALLSADALKGITQGHIWFELNRGGSVAVSDLYNVVSSADDLN